MAQALASSTRLSILAWLKEPSTFTSRREGDLSADGGVCVSLLAERAQMSQPTITRHLEILKRVGLVYTTRVGPWNFHYRNQPVIDELPDLFAQV